MFDIDEIFFLIGRLSKEDIERMVHEAEKYKAEDDVQRDKVSSKNGLESYAFNMKSTVEDDKLAGKISDDDKKMILDKCNEVIGWLDKNQVNGFSDGVACIFVSVLEYTLIQELFCRLPRGMSMNTNRRNWRRCAAPSSPSCTRVLVVCQVVCQRACPVASLELVVLPLVVVDHLALPLRRLTKQSINVDASLEDLKESNPLTAPAASS